jgi:hypothetical protein
MTSEGAQKMFRDAKLSYYPLSLVIFIIWVLYTSGIIALLQYAVSHPGKAGIRALQEGPDYLLTIFAQGHLTITGMYLSRLGMTALQSPQYAPKTWLEMFWFTNKQWQGPAGWGTTILGASKRQMRISITFILFIIAAVFAFPAPILLKRAFPPTVIEASQPFTFPTSSLAVNATNVLDPYTQVNIGQAGWSSGLTVEQTYAGRVYTPTSSSASNSTFANTNDLLFSADIQGYDGVLPGIRVNGGCNPMDTHETDLGPAPNNATSTFLYLCDKLNLFGAWISDFNGMNITGSIGVCHSINAVTMEDAGKAYWNATERTEKALIWLSLSDYSKAPASQGFVQCSSDITTGTAHIMANLPTEKTEFDDFAPMELFEVNTTTKHVPFWPPIFTALNIATLGLDSTHTDDQSDEAVAMWQRFISEGKMLGFTLSKEWDDERQLYRRPTLDEAAAALWSGVLHMVAAVNVGASQDRMEAVTDRYFVSWWGRSPIFFACSVGVLGVWLATMLVLTMLLYRPASAASMDSYTIVRLCAERPDLLEGYHEGELGNNPKMLEPFRLPDFDLELDQKSISDDNHGKESQQSHCPNLPILLKSN